MIDTSLLGSSIPKWLENTDDIFKRSFENKKKYDEFLKSERYKRLKKDKDKVIQ